LFVRQHGENLTTKGANDTKETEADTTKYFRVSGVFRG